MKIIYTAIFGEYEELKEPTTLNPGWRHFCFTDQPFVSKNWEIVKTPLRPEGPQITSREIKILPHKFIPEYTECIWIDGSFRINCDLDAWWANRFYSPFTCINHPIRSCAYKEADACIRHQRGNIQQISEQIKKYKTFGLPENNGVISSGLLMRKNTLVVKEFCEKWFQEVLQNSTRDQIAFAYLAWKGRIHTVTRWDYRKQNEFIFTTHFNRRKNDFKNRNPKLLGR